MELHIHLLSGLVKKFESMNTKSWHVAVIQGDADVIQQKRQHMTTFRMVREKVPYTPPKGITYRSELSISAFQTCLGSKAFGVTRLLNIVTYHSWMWDRGFGFSA